MEPREIFKSLIKILQFDLMSLSIAALVCASYIIYNNRLFLGLAFVSLSLMLIGRLFWAYEKPKTSALLLIPPTSEMLIDSFLKEFKRDFLIIGLNLFSVSGYVLGLFRVFDSFFLLSMTALFICRGCRNIQADTAK